MRYEPAADNPPPGGCQSGTRALALAIRNVYPELHSLTNVYGCYSHRRMAGSPRWSLHAEGRACDVGTDTLGSQLAWRLACDLSDHRVIYGVMRVIWDAHIWSVERVDEWRPLDPKLAQHHDHLHIEQYWEAARRPATVQPQLEAALRAGRA